MANKQPIYSAKFRFWHWANAIVISGSLITMFINLTVLKPRKAAPSVLAEVQKSNTSFTLDQARTAVGSLEDKVWEWHVYFGFALAALLIFRIIAEFFEIADNRFINLFKQAWLQFKQRQNHPNATHDFIVKVIYLIFYILLFIMVSTGLTLVFGSNLQLSNTLLHSVKEMHGFCMYLIVAYIIVHIAGVLLAERKDNKGIVSNMINGGEE